MQLTVPPLTSIALTLISFSTRCKKGHKDRFGPFYVSNETTVFMEGNMGRRVNKQFARLIKNYPDIRLIIMGQCPGSDDDEELFKAARQIRSLGINIHLPPNAVIESGASDLFFSGLKRTMETGAKIGVHSWNSGRKEATDYPVGHKEHELYIQYYSDMFCNDILGEELNFFIINAATSDGMHFMTADELNYFGILTD